jgi:hypothetical protein
VTLLLRQPPASAADVAATAAAAEWKLPRRLAAIACSDGDLGAIAGRTPVDALVTVVGGTGCVIVPDPTGPGRRKEIERLAARATLALGPETKPSEVGRSWDLATSLLGAAATGVVTGSGLLRAEDHLPDLLLAGNPTVTSLIAARRLAPLEGLTARARERMQETALAYVRHQGNAVAMAAELHVHPQTARYRITRLRELFGDDLGDPDARFELELALRAERVVN